MNSNEQKIIQELIIENESLLNKIYMIQAHNKEQDRNAKKLSTSFLQLLDLFEMYRHNLEYDPQQTEQMKYEFLENLIIEFES